MSHLEIYLKIWDDSTPRKLTNKVHLGGMSAAWAHAGEEQEGRAGPGHRSQARQVTLGKDREQRAAVDDQGAA